jgi:ribosome biogenesis GTPase / thiamine phosphate phosphatase
LTIDASIESATPSTPPPPSLLTGRVIRTQSGFFFVETARGVITCQISGKLKIEAQRAVSKDESQRSDLVALNDTVTLELQQDGSGIIVEVAPRRHVLSRTAPGAHLGTSAEEEQIILANTDQVIFVLAAKNPTPKPRALDRLIVMAEKAEIPSIAICINKIDIADRTRIRAMFEMYAQIGYTVVYLSALQGENLDTLRQLLFDSENQKVSVFVGSSGVGKSSLLNALKSDLQLQTGAVSEATTKGKHTTRFSQLIHFRDGGYVADTPGIRTVAPWDIEPHELDGYFIEFRDHIANCKFADCSHQHEPGCAVIAAVKAGTIPESRYESYCRLRAELEEQYIY